MTDLRARLWSAVETATEVLEDADNPPELRLWACHCITQASMACQKLIASTEWESRLRAIELELESR